MREVVLTADAERDLDELIGYIAAHDSPASAERVLARILTAVDQLRLNATRGSVPAELRALGQHDYRQVFFKPYRLIYREYDARVVVFLIADGRRDLQGLLERRVLQA